MLVFKYLGFEVIKLGAGKRDADGIAKDRRGHFAVIYDCKCRGDGFTLLAGEERTMIEYIRKHKKMLENEGINRIHFAIISSSFNAIPESRLKQIEREADINEVVFIRVNIKYTHLSTADLTWVKAMQFFRKYCSGNFCSAT